MLCFSEKQRNLLSYMCSRLWFEEGMLVGNTVPLSMQQGRRLGATFVNGSSVVEFTG